MKNTLQLIIIILFFINFNILAKNQDVFIELGQNYPLKKNISKIWIENPKIIAAVQVNNSVNIKSLLLGQSQIRINNDIQNVFVVPVGSLESYTEWKKLSQKFIQLKPTFCGEYLCLKGKIFSFTEFEKIIELKKSNASKIYLAFEVHASAQKAIDSYLENYQRNQGLTPLKVLFSEPWKLQYSNKDFSTEYKNKLENIGILALDNKQKIDINDNIKVSIQVTEIKKEFSRQLGIQYPSQYSAQLLKKDNFNLDQLELALHAHENEGDIKVLASPNLLCKSGKEAEFFAGGEFPIKVLNYKVSDIVWKKYGISLKVKPTIDSIGQMSLQIDSEISSLDDSLKVEGIPGLHTHKVSSYFDLLKSKTIALSGLIKNEEGKSSEGLPYLRQIPILGRLFSSESFRQSRSELVIFVTPELVNQYTEAL